MTVLSLPTVLGATPVLPVVTIENAHDAGPVAQALMCGGIAAMEITLRTNDALEAVRIIASELPEMFVGVGTVSTPGDLEASVRAGAKFAVSPGSTPTLLRAARTGTMPLLPGIATASELMLCLEHDFRFCKFFPAASSGGVDALKAFRGPFADVRFCPTGGIGLATARSYLALPNVVCVGGSWLTPVQTMRDKDWKSIDRLATEAIRELRPKT
jgi:2-dehydro-3-deoxyphosphogluconate aldolase / (4S)-4-hydroxy-2-oxoglutarate aldolase